MQSLTRAGMKSIREAVEVALQEVGADLGVGLSLGNGSFREHEGHFRLNVGLGWGRKYRDWAGDSWRFLPR